MCADGRVFYQPKRRRGAVAAAAAAAAAVLERGVTIDNRHLAVCPTVAIV